MKKAKKIFSVLLAVLLAASVLVIPSFAADGPTACPKCGKSTFLLNLVKEPTCTEGGYTLWKCINSECGYSENRDIVPALGHTCPTPDEWSATKDDPEARQAMIDLFNERGYAHNVPVTAEEKCTMDETYTVCCTRCQEVYYPARIYKAPGHQWSEWVTVKPGCETYGGKQRNCTVCGKVEQDPDYSKTPTLHNMVKLVEGDEGYHAPYCGEPYEYYKCTKCGKLDKYQLSIAHVDEDSDYVCDVCGASIPRPDDYGWFAQIIKWITTLIDAFKSMIAGIKGDSIL